MRRLRVHPLTPLFAYAIVLAMLLVVYASAGYAPSRNFDSATSLAWPLLVACWAAADARRRRVTPCFDFGFFCYALLPIAVPAYCLWSRGWRGMLTLLGLSALAVLPFVVEAVALAMLCG